MMAQQGAMDQILAMAAQQVANANQQMSQAASPEQQLLDLERQKLELEKEKIGLKSIADAAGLAIKNRQLDLQDEKQMADAARDGVKIVTNVSEADKDRAADLTLKNLDILADAAQKGLR